MTFVAPAGYQPVYSPVIPYLGPIYGGVREGMSIYIQGSIPDDITRFFVNLICGESESSDIALHFNPRFDGWDKVVFNSRQDGSWGQQEKIRKMPFSKRQAFEMLIIVTPQNYQIKVNGKDFFTFSHRIPVEKIHGIHVAGDVSIQTINILGGGFPGCGVGGGHPGGPGGCIGPGGFPGSHLPCMGGKPVYNPTLPYSSKIPGGMCPKRTIIIRGMVPHGGDSLRIDFVVSKSRDIAFHLNPRAKEGTVVRNSFIGKSWGKEERELSSVNPFIEGQYFDMSIRFGTQSFKVFVNGQHLFDFSHRMPFTEIDKLEMEGNMLISYIHF